MTQASLIAQPHPFSSHERIITTLPPGLTIGEGLDEIDWPLRLDQFTHITVDGVEILRPEWDTRALVAGEQMIATVMPQGGEGGSKQIIGLIAIVAISLVAPYAGALITGAEVGSIAANIAAMGVTLVGSLAVGALLRPPGLALGSSPTGEATPQYSMQGQANIASPYGPIPRVYGRQRVKPRIAAEPYTVNLYNDNFLFVLYDFGYGPLQLEDLRIGDTPVLDFQGADYRIHENFVEGSPLELYTNDTHSESLQADISDQSHASITRATPAGAVFLVLEVTAPQGQFYQNKGGEANGTTNVFTLYLDGVPTPPTTGYTNRPNTYAYAIDTASVIQGGAGPSTHRNPFSASFFYPMPQDGAPHTITITPGFAGSSDPAHIYTMILIAIRTYSAFAPIAPRVPHTIVELRVRASGQLSGMIESFSAMATSKLQPWLNFWSEPIATRNPAWIYLDILRGTANNRPVPDERIDLPAILAWAEECNTPPPNDPAGNFTCDITFDAPTTVRDALQMVAAAGRAAPAMRDLKVSVIRESAVPAPMQLITPRNSWNFNASMNYIDPPHALKIQYLSEITWEKEELTVYADGYDGSNASKFESLDLPGTCRAQQAWRFGRYYLAAGMLRRERGAVSMDVENLIAQRGDQVLVAHDVLEVGGPAARVLTINYGLGTIVLDSDLVTANVSGIRVRRTSGGLTGPMPVLDVIGVNALRIGVGDAQQIEVGDLIVYGIVNQITGDYLVESIEPGQDLTATVRFIEHRPEILQADTGPIPPRVPKPGTTPDGSLLPVTGLAITATTVIVGGQALYEFRLSWNASPLAARYVVSALEPGGWVQVGETAEPAFVDLKGWQQVTAGERTYSVIPLGRLGAAGNMAVVSVTVNPSTDKWPPPPVPGDVKVTIQPRGILVTWIRPSYDFAFGFMVRLDAAPAFFITADSANIPPQLVGTHTVTVATIDRTGTESVQVAVTFTIVAPSKVRLTGQAIVNNAILRWSDPQPRPGVWAGQTSHAIEHYEVTKEVPDTPLAIRASKRRAFPLAGAQNLRLAGRGFAQPRSGVVIVVGNVSTEYLVLEEQSVGLWRYSVRPVDVAGNAGPWASIDLILTAPDNYFALDIDDNIIPESTTTNFFPATVLNEWIAPFDMAITYQAHFTQGSWATPQDIVDDGMPYWAQPPAADSLLEWEHDYENAIPPVRLTVMPVYEVIAGDPVIALNYYTRVLSTDAWIDRGEPIPGTMIPSGQHQIKITMQVTPGTDGKGFAAFDRIEYKLDVEFFTETGEVLISSSGTTTIVLAHDFTDVRTVQLTSGDADIENLWYQVATDQQSITIWTTDSTGAPEAGLVSWSVRGF